MSNLASMMGAVPEDIDLELALKRGDEPIRWTYGLRSADPDADALVPTRLSGDTYSVTVAGSCLTPGRHSMQYVNTSASGGAMHSMEIEQSSVPPGEDENVEAYDCEEEEEE